MKKVENYLNIIHFCFYRARYKLHLLMNKINPARLILKIPILKRRFERLGIDVCKRVNETFENKEYGFSVITAGSALVLILLILFLAVFNILIKLLSENNTLSNIHFVICLGLSVILSYFFVFKKDKYLKYFKKF